MSRSSERRARKIALWLLYATDVTGAEVDETINFSQESMDDILKSNPELWTRVTNIVNGVTDNLDALNESIQAVSPRWKLNRMAAVDRNILRIGAWEILNEGLPPLPVINSCVDLGKEYGEKTTSGFVNGLLDEICKQNAIEISKK